MRIAITGGAGFIGSHLSRRLIDDLHDVTIIDNLDPYYSIERKQMHLQEIKKSGTYTFLNVDVRDENAVMEVFKHHTFDTVVHLAALPGVSYSVEKPLPYLDYDIKATVNVLKASGENGVKHVLFASSSSVYGNIESGAFHERMKIGEVESPYAAAKAGAESFCHAFHKLYGFRLSILRLFTVYGPWGRPDMAIPKFTERLLAQQPIEIFSMESARDYTYIDDCIEGIMRTLTSDHAYDTFNIGSGNPVSMKELLSVFKSHFPDMEVIERPWRKGDVKMTWADLSHARAKLDYVPKIGIEEGIGRTIQWARSINR
ncbi:GDP-mannose 4,6-dehydratase [Pseudalkalibacillus sp. SCS-8]|uniref:GDP-mannose 4,6-dehydratase n=1 Tax=Pseudalkalibacillus nanhaiensis TaxID=3115291 RepID=UPI0032DB085E